MERLEVVPVPVTFASDSPDTKSASLPKVVALSSAKEQRFEANGSTLAPVQAERGAPEPKSSDKAGPSAAQQHEPQAGSPQPTLATPPFTPSPSTELRPGSVEAAHPSRAPVEAVRAEHMGIPSKAPAQAAPDEQKQTNGAVKLQVPSSLKAPAATAASVPVATSAEGCASGDCLPDAPTQPAPAISTGDAQHRWKTAVEALRGKNPRLGKSLTYARLISLSPSEARLAFPSDAGFHRATVFGHARTELQNLLGQHLGQTVQMVEEKSAEVFASASKSVAEQESHDKANRERNIESKVRQNSAVQSVMRVLGGTLEHVQVLEPAPKDEGAASAEEEA